MVGILNSSHIEGHTVATMLENVNVEPVWCVAANIVQERGFGPGGVETRSGTKHFVPGAKVYIVDFYWGMGAERVIVVGHHRKSHRYITSVERSEWLTNWRAELVYSPHILRQFKERSNTVGERMGEQAVLTSIWDGTAEGKKQAEELAKWGNQHAAQPDITS